MGHGPADDDGADDVAVSAYFLASPPSPCVFFVCVLCVLFLRNSLRVIFILM